MSYTVDQVAVLDANPEMVEAKRVFIVEFASETIRLIEDVIPRTLGGDVYQPCLGWVEAPSVDRADLLDAIAATYRVGAFTASPGEDVEAAYAALAWSALHDEAEWMGAPITQGFQLYSAYQPVGGITVIHKGWIAKITPSFFSADAYLTIRAESMMARRNWTPLGEYTDRDQQRRHPGDKGCEFVPSLKFKVRKGWLKG